MERQQRSQPRGRYDADSELPGRPHVLVCPERARAPRDDGEQGDERKARHLIIFAEIRAAVGGIRLEAVRADRRHMIWPVAALAVLLLGFVVVYGSAVQARLHVGPATHAPEDAPSDTDSV